MTYIKTEQGFLFLTVVLDLFSRMIVGWSMSANMGEDVMLVPLRMPIIGGDLTAW